MFNPYEKVFDTETNTLFELDPINALFFTINPDMIPPNIKKVEDDGYFLFIDNSVIIGVNLSNKN